MIKAIIFDIGGVLLRTEDPGPRRRLEAKFGLKRGEVERLVFNSELGTRAQAGEIGDEAVWQGIGAQLGLAEAEITAFREAFWAGDELDAALVTYIRALRPAYQTAILSNATDRPHHGLTEPIADAFDLVIWSADEKLVKPDERIYRLALARLDVGAAEAVFIDDSLANVEAAAALGMHTVHYRAGMDLPATLARLGVKINDETERGAE